ncbi:sulfurtransferase [Microbacterium sp. B2969]|uniref:Sulfurtransferase n=1 Tax=Microbacterium alkaliflavum TaxID=3248839 RepID=A0ABW7QAJ6_9MICO
MPHLIAPRALHTELASGRPVRMLDVRWRLDVPEGRPAYVSAHLPEAVYVNLERELAKPGYPEEGRYPLPDLADLEQSARRWGIDDGDLVIAYDDNDAVAAARAWWLLRTRGVDIRVLDGGLRGWVAEGLPLERGDRAPQPGSVTLLDVDPGTATIDDAARAPITGHLVDTRAPEQYRGIATGLDPVAGHIPGAVNVPAITHIARDGTLKSPAEIRAAFEAYEIDLDLPITLYCGAGIGSAHTALALAHAGVEARVFPGSWSQWSRSQSRPVAVGRTPAGVLQAW